MNIIIDPESVETYREKYTVLQLDTVRLMPENKEIIAYCVVEVIPIMELPLTDSKKKLHASLIENYRKRDWNFCHQALDQLTGSWNKEVDSFYDDLRGRLNFYMQQDPGVEWDGTVEKHTA
jgi:hypothetical protein